MVTELFGSTNQYVSDPVLDRLRKATLGSYDVAGELGRGGMAIVYVARDMKLERTVAIKVMDPRLSLTQGMAERFLNEARIAARLQHPNIIVVHDIRQSEDLIFFVMGLIEGGALDELCHNGTALPIEQVRWILLQAARALAFAHGDGVTHRDIKPANILVNLKGDIILTDFGIAKAVGGDSMTKSGTQIGTPTYMAPEQFGNQPTGPASDQYALGVTAYQLLTGRTPFTGDLYQLVAAHLGATPVPLRELRPDCPAFLANAVMRMLEKAPEDRWPSLEDLEGVFGANMPMDGGTAKRQLALSAQQIHKQRASTVSALTAKVPMSPTPTNATPRRAEVPAESAHISISPPGATLFVGGTLELKARVTDDSGDPITGSVVQWTSSNAAVVTVQPDGSLTGVAPGAAIVRASARGASEDANIRVEPAPLARVTVTAPKITIRSGDLVRPDVAAIDVNGSRRDDVSFSWISRSPSVAEIDGPGCIRGIAPGDALIEVSAGNVRRLIEVAVVRRRVAAIRINPIDRVLELGDARALKAITRDDQGAPAAHATLQWTSSEPSVIHIDSAGTALAIGPGISVITAAIDDVSDSIELESIESAIGTIELVLAQNALEIGESTTVGLRVSDITGAPRSSSGVIVSSSAPAIAAFDAESMTIRALAVGTAQIRAEGDTLNGVKQATVAVTVTAIAVAHIQVLPESLELELGAVAALTVRYLDARGRLLDGVTGVVESASPGVIAVERGSIVRGISAGATEVRVRVANADGQTIETRIPVRVQKARLARLVIIPAEQSIRVAESVSLSVEAWDTTGARIDDVSLVWQSSDVSIAEVSANGRVTALRAGSVIISADSGGRTKQMELTVLDAPLARLAIQSPAPELVVGTTVRLAITASDVRGEAVTPNVQFTLEPADAGRVDGYDLTPLRAGTIRVRAVLTDRGGNPRDTSAGVREAVISLGVRKPRLESVTVEPAALTLKAGERRRVTLHVMLEGGQESVAPQVTWSSTNPNFVSVDASGELCGVAAGESRVEAVVGGKRAATQVTVRPRAFSGIPTRALLIATTAVAVLALAWKFWPKPVPLEGPPITTAGDGAGSGAATGTGTTPGAGTATGTGTTPGAGTTTVPAGTPGPTLAAPTLKVDPTTAAITVGDSIALTAAVDSSGVKSVADARWKSLNSAVATITSSTYARARSAGEVRVVATRGALSDTTVLKVAARERKLAAIRVSGVDGELPVGTTARLNVALLDEQRVPMAPNAARVRWSSSDAKAVSVSADGVVTVLADRTATITAAASGLVGSIEVRGKKPTVTPPVIPTVVLPVVRTALEELDAVLGTFDRNPTDRTLARTTLRRVDSLGPLLPANTEQARAALYVGRAYGVLGQKDEACSALSRARTLRPSAALAAQIDAARRTADCIATPPVVPTPSAVGKSQNELKAELDSAVYRYARAFESRDANRLRTAFPAIPQATLEAYAGMFKQAREIVVTVSDISATGGPLSEAVGNFANAAVPVVVKIRTTETKESRTEWKIRLQRTASGWQIVSIN